MIPVDEARARILRSFARLPAEQVAISEAAGRVLAEDVASRATNPPRAVSAMDGYAIRAADAAAPPVVLEVVGEAPAGGAYDVDLLPGQAVRIFTGGPLPPGADSIVIQENAVRDGDRVAIGAAVDEGRYVRRKGLDFSEGDPGPRAGRRLGPREIGLTAAMNAPWVKVTRKPRVAIVGAGDELVMPGEPLGPNRIVSSNTLALAAIVEDAGGDATNLGIARDDETALRDIVRGAARADLLVVAGGMSVGERDLVRAVLAGEGLELDFWKVAMRPGKPLAFGSLGPTPMLGFPGNPVSALVCGLLFLRPAVSAMLGETEPADGRDAAVLGVDLDGNDERQDYLRAALERGADGVPVARPFPRQDSSMLAALADADCLVVRPPHAPPAAAGSAVEIVRL